MTPYPRYPAYKPSGVDWLGDLPAHWETRRLKFVADVNSETLDDRTDPSYEMLYIDISNVTQEGKIIEHQEFRFENAPSRARRRVRAGDTLISTVRTYLQAIAYLESPAPNWIASTGFAVLRPREFSYPKFLYYLVRSQGFVDTVMAYSVGVGYPAVNPSILAGLPGWLPPLPEQRAIVAYLDRETARLDALIDKKHQLIDLLGKQRAALISHAVTKGLNPHAKMKPSGVEWLGEVPEGWEVTRIKRIAEDKYNSFIDGDWIESPYITDNGIRLIQTGNIGIGNYREQGFRYISEETFKELHCKEFFPGDVLICRLAEPVGRACLAPNIGARMITSVDVCILRPRPEFDNRFVVYFFSSTNYLEWLQAICRGGTRDRVSRYMLGSIEFLAPPFDEQRAIADYLDRETTRIDALITKIEDSIGLLQRQRVALISAAVTGKMDVRGL